MGINEYEATDEKKEKIAEGVELVHRSCEGNSDDESRESDFRSPPYHQLSTLDKDDELVEGKVDWKGRPAIRKKHGGLHVSMLLLVTFLFERLAAFFVAVSLSHYLQSVFHFSISGAANAVTNFIGTSYFASFPIAFLADTYIGRCRTLGASICITIFAFILTTIQAHYPSLKPTPCNSLDPKIKICEPIDGNDSIFLYISLYLMATGVAGIKSTLPAQGADQFEHKDPQEAKQLTSFFNMFLFFECIGGAIGLTVLVYVQSHMGWDWSFGLAALGLIVAALVYFWGIPKYRIQPVQKDNAFIEILQVYVAAFRNRKLALPQNANDLYELDKEKESNRDLEFIPRGDTFRFLEKAAIRSSDPSPSKWKLCRVTQVENAKILLGVTPIFCCTIIMTTGQAQLSTYSIHQGLTMDTRFFGFTIQPASLPIIPTAFILITLPIYDRVFIPFTRKITGLPTGITHLRRIGVGLFLSSLAMAGAALVEIKRKRTAIENGMVDARPVLEPLPISIFWLSYQYFIYGVIDMFTNVGMLAFFYDEAPKSLKSISSSLLWVSLGIGYFFSTVLVKLVNSVTGMTHDGAWLGGDNINRLYLERFYCLIAVLCLINFYFYLFCAHRYKYRSSLSTHGNAGGH